MKNQYYQIIWLDVKSYNQLTKLIKNDICNFKITGGWNDTKLIEVEFNKIIKAKNNKEAKKNAIAFTDKEGIEIFSLIKYNTEIILTEEDL